MCFHVNFARLEGVLEETSINYFCEHLLHVKYCIRHFIYFSLGFRGSSVVKNSPTSAGNSSSIPESGRSPGEGNGNPLQYSHVGNPMDRGAWQAIDHGLVKELHRI